jgi:hypothetical protein
VFAIEANRKLGDVLVGFGALLVCCAAASSLTGLLAAIRPSSLLKSTMMIAMTMGGLSLVFVGLALNKGEAKRNEVLDERLLYQKSAKRSS